MSAKFRILWTFAITSIALFAAIPSIRKVLHATVETLEWTASAVVALFGAFAAFFIPSRKRAAEVEEIPANAAYAGAA